MNRKYLLLPVASLSLATIGGSAASAAILANTVAIGAVGAVASSNFGTPYTTDRTINQSDLSGSYVSGVTSTAVIDGFTNLNFGNGWHGGAGESTGTITFDLGGTYSLDRVFLFWMNGGGDNNIANFAIDVSGDAGFSSFTTVASFGMPSAPVNRIDFTSLGVGQYVRLSWTGLQGLYPGLNEFVAGGVAVTGGVPEPASWAMLIAGFGLTGAAMRRRRAGAALV
jgi:hypothetical protein